MLSSTTSERFDDIVLKAVDRANRLSLKYVYIEVILWAFLKDDYVKNFLIKHHIKYDELMEEVDSVTGSLPTYEHKEHNDDEVLLPEHAKILKTYYLTSNMCNEEYIEDKDVLFTLNMIASFLFMKESFSQNILLMFNINQTFLLNVFTEYGSDFNSKIAEFLTPEEETKTSNKQSFLKTYTTNLTERVKSDSWYPIIGREKEMELLQQVLLRHDKPNAIIVGNEGIGKTKLVEGLAKLYSEKYPDYTFFQLDNLALISNILLKGELENRIKGLYSELEKNGKAILFIDEIQGIFGSSDSSTNSDVSTLIKPILSSGTVKVIGTTSFEDFHRYIEKDSSFLKKFFRLNLEAPTVEETKAILTHNKTLYENAFGVKYPSKIVDLIIDSVQKYFPSKGVLEVATDIFDTVGAMCRYNNVKKVSEEMVYKTLSALLNIPLSNISQSEEDVYQHLEEKIKKEIIGQDEAVEKFADAIIISKSGLRETNKTASSLMFMGESGVGKTEICRVLSKIMNIPLVRFDMSEYMEEHSVSKLLGSPPGYKDSGNGKAGNGLLINAIDENPNCILLLDEIEKANTKIHNILLQVMDNGQLTSSLGKTVHFENVFLVMTSNVGSYNSHKLRIGFGNSDESPSDEDFKNTFLPEFRNRIDAAIRFNSLPKNVMKSICEKFLNELKETLNKKKITFKWNQDVVDYIVDNVEKSGNGARPMKHIITNKVKNKIAKDIVFGKFKNGGKIILGVKDNEITFGEN